MSASKTDAESSTIVKPLDMDDDDDVQESGVLETSHQALAAEEAPPPKPPRPLSPMAQAEATLKEAFPSIDAAVIKAVLVASGGNVEPAFNALLGMSDPDAARESTPPPQPPRPAAVAPQGSTTMSQLEADEMYARQLAEHYDARDYGARRSGQRERQRQASPQNSEDNRNFFDDDLPVIKENLLKGFLETQSKVNGWITNLKKKIDGEDEDEQHSPGFGSSSQSAPFGRRSADGRRSGDYNRYDADPQVLGDDFAGMHLNQDAPQRRTTRPLANPDLFKPTPNIPKGDGRHVAFNENEDIYRSSPKMKPAQAPAKASKWQPLSNVAPSPLNEGENDPFSLGDSEDEKEIKDRVGGKEIKVEDTERSKEAVAEADAAEKPEPSHKPEPAEVVGTKDKVAEEKLTS